MITLSVMILAVYILAALLPAAYLTAYVYRYDTVEKEPVGLLAKLLLYGVAAAALAAVGESIATPLVELAFPEESALRTAVFAFLAVAVVEEGSKFLLLKRATWRDPNFNFRFDGIVYAVFVSLGFAAIENLIYVFRYGLSVAPTRALLAVPGHMSFGVFMGIFYGRAKLCERYGDTARCRKNLWIGYLLAVLHHGFYDACAMIGTRASMIVFLVFVVAMFLTVRVLVKKESASDTPV